VPEHSEEDVQKSGQIIKDFYCAVNNEKRHFTRRKKNQTLFLEPFESASKEE